MSENLHPTHSGRPQSNAQDLTPYSAVRPEECYSNHWEQLQQAVSDSNTQVSSFNLPLQYDSTLITPVSSSSSPSMQTKSAPALKRETEIKLSPTIMSPSYHIYSGEDDLASPRFNEPMKHKDPSGVLQISTADSSFPISPYICMTPYYGSFGVSAANSAKTSGSSPGLLTSPHPRSAGGLSSTDSHQSRQQTPSSYRSNYQAPILIAPNPQTLRPATNYTQLVHRQNSLQSNGSTQSPPHSEGPRQGAFTSPLSSVSPRGKKRKQPPSDYEQILQSSDINSEERLLLELSGRERLPWKEIEKKFNEKTGQSKKQAALQMRKKRLLDRLRVWTNTESKSLNLAHEEYEKDKWLSISKGMLKHGTRERWPKEAVQRKWNNLHPEQATYALEYDVKYEMDPRNGHRVSPDLSVGELSANNSCWSDEGDSSSHHSLHECDSVTLMSALSNVSMDEVRNRALSDANAQIQMHQQQLIYDQQQRNQNQHQQQHQPQNGWDSAS